MFHIFESIKVNSIESMICTITENELEIFNRIKMQNVLKNMFEMCSIKITFASYEILLIKVNCQIHI